jgi:hypothetical protein
VASALAPKEVTGLEYFSSSAVRELITLFCSIPMLFEIDGATQVWHSSARYAQFRAPAFPSSAMSIKMSRTRGLGARSDI